MWSVCRLGDPFAGPGRGTANADARAAPIVPDDKANAVEELRPSDPSASGPAYDLTRLTVRSGDHHIDLAWV